MSLDAPEALRAAILSRHKSVYAFCKAHQRAISKSVVALVLAGKYPGNVQKQQQRIRDLIEAENKQPSEPVLENIITTLGMIACNRCPKRKRKQCRLCKRLWAEQAEAVLRLITVFKF